MAQFRGTGNIGQTRHRTKTNKTQHNTENEKDERHGHHKKPEVRCKQFLLLIRYPHVTDAGAEG